MTAITQEQYDEVVDLTGGENVAGAVFEALGLALPTPPDDNTFIGLAGQSTITITPDEDAGGWTLSIPFTGSREDSSEGPIEDTNWGTLQGAIASLRLAYSGGYIKYNDGRTVV